MSDECHSSKCNIDPNHSSNSLRGQVLVCARGGICLSICVKLLLAVAGHIANPSIKLCVLAKQPKDLAYGLNERLPTAERGERDTVVLMERLNHRLEVYSLGSQDLCGRSECIAETKWPTKAFI